MSAKHLNLVQNDFLSDWMQSRINFVQGLKSEGTHFWEICAIFHLKKKEIWDLFILLFIYLYLSRWVDWESDENGDLIIWAVMRY